MDIQKYIAARDKGILPKVEAVGPATVGIWLPNFCPHSGESLEPAFAQMNLEGFDTFIAQVQGQANIIAAQLAALHELRAAAAAKMLPS